MDRNGTLEYARLVAAFGIVFFHAKAPGSAIGYAALPFFLILLIVLAVPAAGKQAFGPYMKGRAQRLLIPWLIWSAVYGLLKVGDAVVTGNPLSSEFDWTMLFTGPALHLWFLPFAFVACMIVHPTVALMRNGGGPVLALLFMGAALGAIFLQQAYPFGIPLQQWCFGLPAVFLGLALASWQAHLVLRAMLLTGFLALAVATGALEGLPQLALAASAYLLCVALPSPDSWLARQAGAAAMGVYLAHPLFISVLTRATPVPDQSLALGLLACLGALLLTLAIALLQSTLQQRVDNKTHPNTIV